jgi:hypothetical protein
MEEKGGKRKQINTSEDGRNVWKEEMESKKRRNERNYVK